MMYYYNSEKVAEESAREKKLGWGWSIYGGWYVGNPRELERVGVVRPRKFDQGSPKMRPVGDVLV